MTKLTPQKEWARLERAVAQHDKAKQEWLDAMMNWAVAEYKQKLEEVKSDDN